MARCTGLKGDGSQCGRIVGDLQQFCYAHDPSKSEQRRAAASKAGKTRTGGELPEIKNKLRQLADDVLNGTVDKGVGSVAS